MDGDGGGTATKKQMSESTPGPKTPGSAPHKEKQRPLPPLPSDAPGEQILATHLEYFQGSRRVAVYWNEEDGGTWYQGIAAPAAKPRVRIK